MVIVETVGVGQSETAVAGMTDMFVLMQLPNAGDDPQAIKKGVMELADLVVINKADIDKNAATRARRRSPPACACWASTATPKTPTTSEAQWHPKVLQISAAGAGVDDFWAAVSEYPAANRQRPPGLRRKNARPGLDVERIGAGLKQAFSASTPGAARCCHAVAGTTWWQGASRLVLLQKSALAQSGQAPAAIE